MKQIKLDDKRDLAIDGNEVWIIDYSMGLHNPRSGEKHTFHYSHSPEPITEIQAMTSDPFQAILTYLYDGKKYNKIARIDDNFIAFTDPDAPPGHHRKIE